MSDLSRILLLVDVQWGNLAEWLQALGATGALVVALVLLSKQLSAHRASEEDRRQAPARSVAAWHEHDHGETSLMFVRNAGETPIYSTVLYYTPNAGSRAGKTMEVVFGVVPPGSTHSHPVDGAWRTNEFRQPGVAVAFTDASGGHWRRTEIGELLAQQYAPLTC